MLNGQRPMMKTRKSILKRDESSEGKVSSSWGKELCWGDLEIIEFHNVLGDAVPTDGVPVNIGWKCKSKSVIGVDYYEYLKQQRPRRRRKDLMMSSPERDT